MEKYDARGGVQRTIREKAPEKKQTRARA